MVCLLSFVLAATVTAQSRANPALDGYADDADFQRRVAALAKSDLVKLDTLTKTRGP